MSAGVPPLRVLVVDDSVIAANKLARMLAEMGHAVVARAGSGETAVDAYRASRPDLVTMDITLPGMDGIDTTRRITGEFPAAAIVMVTARGQEAMVIDALNAGARGYVLKPIRAEKLAVQIARAVKRTT